ncbi:hypothetical protein K9M74_05140 [Candidatus Woesearchaeota archaeon]|nr:hypothetical protein [Candidatus Woesearchaeota archaeon]
MSENKQSPQQFPQRQTAKICSINDLFTGEYVVQEGWKPNYVKTINPERFISRVNIIGFIVDKPTPYQFLLDDGTGTITVIDFSQSQKTTDLKVGEPVLIIGRPRQTEGGIFLALEIGTSNQLKEHPEWIPYRKQELASIGGDELSEDITLQEPDEVQASQPADVEEQAVFQTPTEITGDMVFDFVKDQDEGEGCDIDFVVKKFGQEADDIILTLISMGELYEAKPGKLKILE